jgi:hypothetical protein
MGHKKVPNKPVPRLYDADCAAGGQFSQYEEKLTSMERSLLIQSAMRELISMCSPSVRVTGACERAK